MQQNINNVIRELLSVRANAEIVSTWLFMTKL